MRLIRICAAAIMAALGAAGAAMAQEAEAVRQLSELLDGKEGRLIVMAPEQQELPMKPAQFESILTAIASRAARDAAAVGADPSIEVRADSGALRKRLKDVYRTEGQDGWENALAELKISEADFALTGRATHTEKGFAVSLRLIALDGGELVGVTDVVEIETPRRSAVPPRQAFRAVADRMWTAAPDARDLAVIPFKTGESGIVSPAGEPLAVMMMEAWLESAKSNEETDALRGAAPAKAWIAARSEEGAYALVGKIWPRDADSADIALSLRQEGKTLAAARVTVLIRDLPPYLLDYLRPKPAPEGPLYEPFKTLSRPDGALSMALDGGANPIYRLCPSKGPVPGCGRLRLKLETSRPGHAMCFALGDDGLFGILAPAGHYGIPEVSPRKPLLLPDDLPADAGGNRPVWYAMGEPSSALLVCAAWAKVEAIPLDQVKQYNGAKIDRTAARDLSGILFDSAPIGAAYAVVNLAAAPKSGGWR